jgi:hypothetical protein
VLIIEGAVAVLPSKFIDHFKNIKNTRYPIVENIKITFGIV